MNFAVKISKIIHAIEIENYRKKYSELLKILQVNERKRERAKNNINGKK